MAFGNSFSFQHRGWRGWSTMQDGFNIGNDETGLMWYPTVEAAINGLACRGDLKASEKLEKAWRRHMNKGPLRRVSFAQLLRRLGSALA